MKRPVLISGIVPGTTVDADFSGWLEDANGLRPDPGMLIYSGNTICEDPISYGDRARAWTLRVPMPAHLLTRLAAAGNLYCTATHLNGTERVRCRMRVTADGTHPIRHEADPLDQPEHWVETSAAPWPARNARPRRHRAAIMIPEGRLVDLIRLPPGQRVIGFHADVMTLSLAVHLEGEGLPETPEGSEPRRIGDAFGDLRAVFATEPEAIHAGVLEALASPAHLEGHRAFQARLRILERHQPCTNTPGTVTFCGSCCNPVDHDEYATWPCPDYRDAAAPVNVLAWMTIDTDEGDDTP